MKQTLEHDGIDNQAMVTLSETPSARLPLDVLDAEAKASVPDMIGETPMINLAFPGRVAEAGDQVGRLCVMTALGSCSRHDMSGCCDYEQVTGAMQEHMVVMASVYNNKADLCINVPKGNDH